MLITFYNAPGDTVRSADQWEQVPRVGEIVTLKGNMEHGRKGPVNYLVDHVQWCGSSINGLSVTQDVAISMSRCDDPENEASLSLQQRRLQAVRVYVLYPTFGTCGQCLRSWAICRGHTTKFSDREGCFALCEDCWSDLTPETRLPYYEQHWKRTGSDEPIVVWEAIQAAVLAGK